MSAGGSDPTFDAQSEETFVGVVSGGAPAELLCDHYLPRLRAFVQARLGARLAELESASDIVQSVCRELCSQKDAVRFDLEAEFRSWLFTVALNKIKRRARYWSQQKRDPERVAHGNESAMHTIADSLTPSRAAASREELEQLERALASLTEEHREVITLSRIVGLSHQEIAAQTNRSESASRAMLGRALRELAAALRTEV